jgi:uncharacterized protein YjcR
MKRLEMFIQQLFMRGMSDREIASRLNISPRIVENWRRKNNLQENVSKERKEMNKERLESNFKKKDKKEKRRELYERGLNDNSIARELNSHPSAIAKWRHENNLQSNTVREKKKEVKYNDRKVKGLW